jgi:hypothetical protein
MWVTNIIKENVPAHTGRNNIRKLVISTHIMCLTARINRLVFFVVRIINRFDIKVCELFR